MNQLDLVDLIKGGMTLTDVNIPINFDTVLHAQ